MADGDAAERGAGEGGADLADVVDEILRLGAGARLGGDAGGGDAVEILAADGEADDAFGEGITVLGDGGLDGCDLVVDAVLAGRRPDA